MSSNDSLQGLLAAGNFIVDEVKMISHWPDQDTLASIHSEQRANGGGPYNVLKNLAAMGADFPLKAAGLIGEDAHGAWILEDCRQHGIDVQALQVTAQASTSYTDAMTVQGSGRRTFFHQRGANAHFDANSLDLKALQCRHIHLAYLMLLDCMDELLSDGSTRAAQFLQQAKALGMSTSVDLVSTQHSQFHEITRSVLPHVDILLINEIEAAAVLGRTLEVTLASLEQAAQQLLELGVLQQVVLHSPQISVIASHQMVHSTYNSQLPEGYIQGATGAGDAFAAGYLYGWMKDWEHKRCLALAQGAAVACLSHPTPSQGLRSVAECLALEALYRTQL